MSNRSRKRRRPRIAQEPPQLPPKPAEIVTDKPGSLPFVISAALFHDASECLIPLKGAADVKAILDKGEFVWIDAHGPVTSRALQELGQLCGIHALALEDVANAHQRPKIEQYERNTYIVLRTVAAKEHLETGQVNVFLGETFLLTVHETENTCMVLVKERIQKSTHRGRYATSGYLAYMIIDTVIDSYFPVLENFADRLDHVEDRLLTERRAPTLAPIYEVKNDLILLRRLVWSHRDMLSSAMRDPPDGFDKDTLIYLRDCYDHTLQQLDLVEIYRESASSLIDHVFSSATHKTNEIMKVLTIVSGIFIPLNFVAGIYGMNFNTDRSPLNMPELNWYYGYPFALGLMVVIGFTLLWVFYRNDWL